MVPTMQEALTTRLANERVRNHLDMRHRLDEDGKRQGKVIEYKCVRSNLPRSLTAGA